MTGDALARLIERTRLIDALAAAPVGLIEAGSGYGKSVLAAQYRQKCGIATAYVPIGRLDRDVSVFASSVRRALRDARLSDMVAAVEGLEPEASADRLLDALADTEEAVLVIVDDAHELQDSDSSQLLMRLARGLSAPHRLLVAARSFHGELESLWNVQPAVHITAAELAFTLEEANQLVTLLSGRPAREHDVRMLVEATHGWATALSVTTGAWIRADRSVVWLASDPVAAPLRTLLDRLPAADQNALISLAHLPRLSPQITDSVAGEGAFERLVAAGLPLLRAGSGWWEFPGPVSDHLAGQGPIDPAAARLAADDYRRGGDELAAVRTLVAAGEFDDAAAVLGGLAPHRVELLGLGVVEELVGSLPDEVISQNPRVLLHVARLAETAHLMERRAAALARALELASTGGETTLLRELQAERARDLMWDERTRGESRACAQAVLKLAASDEAVARARALDVLGRLGGWFSDDGPKAEAEGLLKESARLSRSIGERTWAAQALVALGAGFYFAMCRFDDSLEVLDAALGELPARNRYRAMVLSFRTDSLIELGRFAEAQAAIEEMAQIGRAFGEDWLLAYPAWAEMWVSSYQGDAQRTLRAVTEALRHPRGWLEQPSGVEFLAHAADCLDRVGEHEQAEATLAMARERMEGSEHLVWVHGAAITARSGDPQKAREEIAHVLEHWAKEPQEQWPLLLLRAFAALRSDDPDAAGLAAEAFERCAALGHPNGPFIRERKAAESLLELARSSGATITAIDHRGGANSWAIELLGGFCLRRDGQEIAVPPGRPQKLLQRLAVSDGRMHSEALIEFLWPGASVPVGRNRLRNLLSRLRRIAGELIVRDREAICLADGCEIDARAFELRADEALRASAADGDDVGAGLARAALGLYRGDLLPDEEYDDWVVGSRERLRSAQLELFDLLARAAEANGEIDEAIRVTRSAVQVEPADERRVIALARLLASQGRTGSAGAALEAALARSDTWSPRAERRLEDALRGYRSSDGGTAPAALRLPTD